VKPTRSILLVGLILTLLVVAFLLPSVAQAKNAKYTIIVGTSPDYPPFENLKNGKIVGFDIDLVKEIEKRTGYKMEFQADEFVNLIPGIASQPYAFDMVASALTIVPGREEVMDFSDPYFYSASDPAPYQYYGFGFPTDSPLRGEVNTALQEIKDDGTYVRIYVKWFGVAPSLIP
jgi:ABC-type amino acid transport substrate-binding protein